MYDLTMTAALRPALVDKSLAAVRRHVSHPPVNVLVNIDPAGNQGTQIDVADVVRRHFPEARLAMPEAPSFPLAVKWLWRQASSPALLHIEDSKELIVDLDIPWLLRGLEDFAAVSLKWIRPETEVVRPINLVERSDGFWQTNYYDKAVCMQPTMWRTEVARNLAGWMQHGISPEKVIRPGGRNPARTEVIDYMSQFQFGFVTDERDVFWFRRHGPAWRREAGYAKKGRDGIPDTWKRS